MKYTLIVLTILTNTFLGYCQEKQIEPYKILKGHLHKVDNAFFTPNGKFIISYGWDNTIKIWDAETFTELRTLKGHTDEIWTATVSLDNKLIASGSMDRSCIIWNLETGELIKQIRIAPQNVITKGIIPELDSSLPNSIYSVSFSPNGKLLAFASADKLVRIWDIEKSEFLATLSGHSTNWMWTCFSPDGKYIITGSRDNAFTKGETIIWETESFTQISHINSSGDILFTENNELGINSDSCNMKYYNLSNGKFVENRAYPCYSGTGAISPDKKFIVSGNEDSYIKLWDLNTHKLVWEYKNGKVEVQQANFSPDGKYLIAGTPQSDILVWKVSDLIKDE